MQHNRNIFGIHTMYCIVLAFQFETKTKWDISVNLEKIPTIPSIFHSHKLKTRRKEKNSKSIESTLNALCVSFWNWKCLNSSSDSSISVAIVGICFCFLPPIFIMVSQCRCDYILSQNLTETQMDERLNIRSMRWIPKADSEPSQKRTGRQMIPVKLTLIQIDSVYELLSIILRVCNAWRWNVCGIIFTHSEWIFVVVAATIKFYEIIIRNKSLW